MMTDFFKLIDNIIEPDFDPDRQGCKPNQTKASKQTNKKPNPKDFITFLNAETLL